MLHMIPLRIAAAKSGFFWNFTKHCWPAFSLPHHRDIHTCVQGKQSRRQRHLQQEGAGTGRQPGPLLQTCGWTLFPAQLQCQGKGLNLLLCLSFLTSWLSFSSAGGQSRMHSRKSTLGSPHSSVSSQLRSFTEVPLHSESLPGLSALCKGLNIIGKYKRMGYCAQGNLLL